MVAPTLPDFERAAANGLSNGRVLISRELRRSPFNRPGGLGSFGR
jgi:hypothetical protein